MDLEINSRNLFQKVMFSVTPLRVKLLLKVLKFNFLALWLGGEYVNTAAEPLTGELTVPLANDVQIKLHMPKKADRDFIISLISLIHNFQKAVQLHEDFSEKTPDPSQLIKGRFDGFEVINNIIFPVFIFCYILLFDLMVFNFDMLHAFQEHYGRDDIVEKGAELLVTSISMIYNSLQTTYKGQIVGVVVFNGSPAKESDSMLTVKLTTRQHPWWLQEKGSADFARIAEVALVRKTLAWITGMILVISTLMGYVF